MAYNFFPKSEQEIRDTLKNKPEKYIKNCVSVFTFLKQKAPTIESPIVIDVTKPRIKVIRYFKSLYDVRQIAAGAKVESPFTMGFGDGSSGNRGSQNRGNAFEGIFTKNLQDWRDGETDSMDRNILTIIENLDKEYGIGEGLKSDFQVLEEGAANTKRPLSYSGNIILTNPKGTGNDIGQAVTDITVKWKNKRNQQKTLYLSLKYGPVVTFFNSGIATVLTKKEIQNGKITNNDGKKLLSLLKIDEKLFCDVFNGNLKEAKSVTTSPNISALKLFLESGIGYNYHVIHPVNKSTIKSYKVDEQYMRTAASVSTQTIVYGGASGNAKKVEVVLTSPKYIFKLNFRDTTGTDGYPKRLMCDFKYR